MCDMCDVDFININSKFEEFKQDFFKFIDDENFLKIYNKFLLDENREINYSKEMKAKFTLLSLYIRDFKKEKQILISAVNKQIRKKNKIENNDKKKQNPIIYKPIPDEDLIKLFENKTPSKKKKRIKNKTEITPEPIPEITPEPEPEITPEPTPEPTPEILLTLPEPEQEIIPYIIINHTNGNIKNIIDMINDLYISNENFVKFIGEYTEIYITANIHTDKNNLIKSLHFNARFKTNNIISNQYHLYIRNHKISSITELKNVL